MTMLELQNVLSEVLTNLVDNTRSPIQHQKDLQTAEYTAKISKQMINNADVILRTDKLSQKHDRIDKIVGET